MKILTIIPAYNEEGNIKRVVDNLITKFHQYDYLIINDCSTDNTKQICEDNGYRYIDLVSNLGLSGALQTGFQYAYNNGYDMALQFDGDGQHRPEYISNMVKGINEGYDIIIGSRFINEKKPFNLRMMGNILISMAIFITTGKKINDPTSGMRMFNKKMIKEFALNMNRGPEPDTIAYQIQKKTKIKEVQVQMDERIAGTSYLNTMNSLRYMLTMITSILFIQWFRK